ncbi:hypothetical protein TREES_T100016346 [Tupaia chinensis]|uniref:Secreted protein n=1 Tax=Tupaia chinensis TaxID=246437 RepID=L8YGE6_TUPCH|nr:hypothetical protein TREES_T100016346 [Tupaia chinensis]
MKQRILSHFTSFLLVALLFPEFSSKLWPEDGAKPVLALLYDDCLTREHKAHSFPRGLAAHPQWVAADLKNKAAESSAGSEPPQGAFASDSITSAVLCPSITES